MCCRIKRVFRSCCYSNLKQNTIITTTTTSIKLPLDQKQQMIITTIITTITMGRDILTYLEFTIISEMF